MKLTSLLALWLWYGAPATAEPRNPDTFSYVAILEANSLDPAWAYDSASLSAIRNLYEPLFQYEGASTEKLLPLIAEKVPSKANGGISADGRVYKIPIRKGIRFHDGTPMTAEDVRYSLMRFLLYDRDGGPSTLLIQPLLGYNSTRDEKGHLNPNAYKDAAKAVRLEGDTVVLTLPKPFAPLLGILASWSPVVSKQWTAKNGGWDGAEATWEKFNNPTKESSHFFQSANGTGPFKLDRWDRRVKEMILVRNDGYWRKPAKLARVIIRSISEFATRKLMLQAGDADGIFAERAVLSQLETIPGVKLFDDLPALGVDPMGLFTFQINPVGNPFIGSGKLDGEGIPPDFFADREVRKAFAFAFDYQGYIRDVQRGKGVQATGCVPRGLLGHNPKQPAYRLDLAKSKEHFQKAMGGKVWDKGFHLTLAFNSGNNERQIVCNILKRHLESLNPKFKVDVRSLEWPSFIDAVRGHKVPIFVTSWGADYPDPHNFAFPLMHSRGGYPRIQGYRSPEADKLVESALRETNLEKRKTLYAKLQALEYEDAPHFLVSDPVAFHILRSWVQGWSYGHIAPDQPYGGYFYPLYKSEKP